jgi:signal transduction histidine kinase
LRHTVIATLLIGFALLSAVQYLATGSFVAKKAHNIEITDGFEKLQRLHYALDQLREDLDRTATDWSVWDQLYRFVQGQNPTFIEDSLYLETFQRLKLNVVVVLNEEGEVLFAKALAPKGRELQNVSRDMLATAQRTLATPDQTGFAASSFGPLLVSTRKVPDPAMVKPGHGRLFMARSLELLAPTISKVTAVPASFVPLSAIDEPPDSDTARQAVFADRNALFLFDGKIQAFTPIDDLWGKPLALVCADLARPLQPGLERALFFLLGVTLLVGAVFGIAGLLVLRARVVQPIERIVDAAETIGAGKSSVKRLDEEHGEREFIALSKSINSMLAQIETQQSLRADRDAAIEANRLKSEFLATMSHEIRTPMNGVLGMCELLQRTDLDARQRHLSDTLLRSARSLLGILNDILDFSKIESGKLSLECAPFSPHDIIANASAPFATAAQSKGLEFSVHIDAAVPTLAIGDALRLRQVLNNLLSNAVKFTKAGSIAVNCSVESTQASNTKLRIVVKDTGIGIEPDALNRVFEAFAQAESSTTRRFGGTGLGLAIVRRIVELMGGEVGVDSQMRRGSSFWFTMQLQRPALPSGLLQLPSIDATGPRFATQFAPKVLLAEDNTVNREVLTEMLQAIGCEVTAVDNGVQAVAVIADATFDVVLLDCQMTVMDGYAAAAQLRVLEAASLRKRSFVVALTADATAENKQRCTSVGMDAVLTKPVTQARLTDFMMQTMRTKAVA